MDEKRLQREFGKRLRLLRMERTGLSQERFANEVGIDRTYYASLEQGKHNVTLARLSSIADGLGMTMSEVLEGL